MFSSDEARRLTKASAWKLLEDNRGSLDGWDIKNYTLSLIFFKNFSKKFEEDINSNERDSNPDFDYASISDEEALDAMDNIKEICGCFIKPSELFDNILKNAEENPNLNITLKRALTNLESSCVGLETEDSLKGIFGDFDVESSKLGATVKDKNKILLNLMRIADQFYFNKDVDALGDMYEYLMGMYAANAGKSGGEYFTPSEVSKTLARIVTTKLLKNKEDKKKISVYDPTCGSGSLLLKCVKDVGMDNIKDSDGVCGQEKNPTTYNLAKMNMILHGVSGYTLNVQNADTLEDPRHMGQKFDLIVSNPPYSAKWNVTPSTPLDIRFSPAGVTAPSTKADFAFLMHILYHLKDSGVAGVVLPHGVLFRGNTEETIRKYLIDSNFIDTIIGLPSNVFFGTGIPTVILILKKERNTSDIQIIDASKCYEKGSKKNYLRAMDIERICEAVDRRENIENFSRIVPKDEIVNNGYNLNIPRYISSDIEAFIGDLYSLMTGKISDEELSFYSEYLDNFKALKEDLFEKDNDFDGYYSFKSGSIKDIINRNLDIVNFKNSLKEKVSNYNDLLVDKLITNLDSITNSSFDEFKDKLFSLFNKEDLIDVYELFEIFAEEIESIKDDVDLINSNSLDICKETTIVMDKKKEITSGLVIPFDLIEAKYLGKEKEEIDDLNSQILEKQSLYKDILESLDEDVKAEVTSDKENEDSEDKFNETKLKSYIELLIRDNVLYSVDNYISNLRSEYEYNLNSLDLEIKKNLFNDKGTLLKGKITSYSKKSDAKTANTLTKIWDLYNSIKEVEKLNKNALKPILEEASPNFNSIFNGLEVSKEVEDNYNKESLIIDLKNARFAINEEKIFAKEAKEKASSVNDKIIEKLSSLTDDEIKDCLKTKWITPIISQFEKYTDGIVDKFIGQMENLKTKYSSVIFDTEEDIKNSEKELNDMISLLNGSDSDMKALKLISSLL